MRNNVNIDESFVGILSEELFVANWICGPVEYI
jgi:hypothetical protein